MLSYLRAFLMVLIVVRLMMPPGICACKWSSPAARLLIALMQSDRQIPVQQERDNNDDDHDAGCPASPLSAGMGIAPPCEPHFPPGLALDPPPLPQSALPFFSIATEPVASIRFDSSSTPVYLTVRALLL